MCHYILIGHAVVEELNKIIETAAYIMNTVNSEILFLSAMITCKIMFFNSHFFLFVKCSVQGLPLRFAIVGVQLCTNAPNIVLVLHY